MKALKTFVCQAYSLTTLHAALKRVFECAELPFIGQKLNLRGEFHTDNGPSVIITQSSIKRKEKAHSYPCLKAEVSCAKAMKLSIDIYEEWPGLLPDIHFTIEDHIFAASLSENEELQNKLAQQVFQSINSPLPIIWARTENESRTCCFTPETFDGVPERLLAALIGIEDPEQREKALEQVNNLIDQWTT